MTSETIRRRVVAGRQRPQAYDGRVRSPETMRARLGAPRLFLALALAFSGPAFNQAKAEPADHSPAVIQQATTADTFLPANDVKPCVRKPDHLASAKFVSAGESGGTDEREPHSVVLPGGANARSLSLASSGGGRAPPSGTLA